MTTAAPFVVPVPTSAPPAYVPPPPRPQQPGLARAALVLGIVGLPLACLVLPSLLAVVFGFTAASNIKRSRGALIGLGAARAGWVLGLVSLVGVGGLFVALATGAIDVGGKPVDTLAVGDCIELDLDLAEDAEIFSVPTVACGEPHDGEVYFLGQIDRFDEYPGRRTVQAHVEQRCAGAAFTDYVGVDYADSALGLYSLSPTSASWRDGDRGFTCIATAGDATSLIGTVRDTNR